MTTAGDNITKTSIVASMEALKTLYNKDIVWSASNNPFSQAPANAADITVPASFAEEISDTNVTASTLTTNFKNYAQLLSRIRSVNLLKWYQNQGDPRSALQFNETNITSLNDTYQIAPDPLIGVKGGDVITASDLDAFVALLSDAINTNRTTTVTIEEFYCHSNCHGSCHGSI
jgi:hypothetical protein